MTLEKVDTKTHPPNLESKYLRDPLPRIQRWYHKQFPVARADREVRPHRETRDLLNTNAMTLSHNYNSVSWIIAAGKRADSKVPTDE